MSDIYKVTRNPMDLRQRGKVRTRYGSESNMVLDDDVRHQLGGETVAYFDGEQKDSKVHLYKRVPDPGWT